MIMINFFSEEERTVTMATDQLKEVVERVEKSSWRIEKTLSRKSCKRLRPLSGMKNGMRHWQVLSLSWILSAYVPKWIMITLQAMIKTI